MPPYAASAKAQAMRVILAGVWLWVALLPAFNGVAIAADGLARVRARGTLRWGADVQGGEPYAFQDPQDTSHLLGFEVEIADAVARRLGVLPEKELAEVLDVGRLAGVVGRRSSKGKMKNAKGKMQKAKGKN